MGVVGEQEELWKWTQWPNGIALETPKLQQKAANLQQHVLTQWKVAQPDKEVLSKN